jgi:hypothetical protein
MQATKQDYTMTVMIRDFKEKGRLDRDPILYTILILVPLNIGAATNSTKTPKRAGYVIYIAPANEVEYGESIKCKDC